MLFEKELTLNEAMSNCIAAVESVNSGKSKAEILEHATELLKKNHPEYFEDSKKEEPKPDDKKSEVKEEKKEEVKTEEKDNTDIPQWKKEAIENIANALGGVFDKHKKELEEAEAKKAKKEEPKSEEKKEKQPESEQPEEKKEDVKAESKQDEIPAYDESEKDEVKVESKPQEVENNFDPTNPAIGHIQPMSQPIPMMMPQIPQQMPPQMMQPIHRVDEAPKPPKPAPPAEDNIGVNLPVNFGGLMKPPVIREIPEPINHKLVNPTIQAIIQENQFNNELIISEFVKLPLKEIEQIANQNGHSVMFEQIPWYGLVHVTTVDNFGNVVPPKCFTIDSGMLIDRRAKLIATSPRVNPACPLERAGMYELFMNDAKNHNRKVLDYKLINDIFIAGLDNISKKEMYSEKYKALNLKVALISLPTKGLNKEERNALQDYIMKMDNDGYFDKAISMSPGCRFVFITKQLDKKHLSDFTLINEGVPSFYGTAPITVNPIVIESKDGKISIRSSASSIN